MKSSIKQFLVLLLVGVAVLFFLGAVIPFVSKFLANYEITDSLIAHKNFIILFIIFCHYLLGLVIKRIKTLKSLEAYKIALFFFILYLLLYVVVFIIKERDNFSFFTEFTLVLALIIGLYTAEIKKKVFYLISLVLIAILISFTNFITIPIGNQLKSYHNYTGFLDKSKYRQINSLVVKDHNGNEKVFSTENDKILIIEFWNNNCSICFEKFPKIKMLQKEYKESNAIDVITLNVYKSKDDISTGQELLISTDNETLNNYFIHESKTKAFEINWFPKFVVVKNNTIIFEGMLETFLIFRDYYLK